jgi:hypothetical protein
MTGQPFQLVADISSDDPAAIEPPLRPLLLSTRNERRPEARIFVCP